MGILGVVAFIVALLFSVMVHEFGHFITARKFGMKVTEFFLGFGKRLWSFKRGETEFGIKAIPAGGYCRITGMTVHEDLTEDEKPRAFFEASVPRRLIVLGAGSFLHLILGFLILVIILSGVGTTIVTNKVGAVAPCVINAQGQIGAGACTQGAEKSPAFLAGFEKGDEIVQIGNYKVSNSNWNTAVKLIRNSANKPLNITVKRNGSDVNLTVTPMARTINGQPFAFIGVVNSVGTYRQNPISGVKNSAKLSKEIITSSVTSLFTLPTKVPALIKQTFGHEKRDPNGLVGVVGVARVSAQTASDPSLKTMEKIANFLLIIASLNIFVGIFNLFPLLPLDGGHMAIAVIDGFRRWRARRKGAQRPAPFDIERLMPFTLAVIVVLVGLSLLLLAADIINPVHINQ